MKPFRAAVRTVFVGALVASGCKSPPSQAPASSAAASSTQGATASGSAASTDAGAARGPEERRVVPLDVVAKPLTQADVARPVSCGPFRTSDLTKDVRKLLGDRLRVRFVTSGDAVGALASTKIQVERSGVTLFVGAREVYQRGDAEFDKRAAKAATFQGAYDAVVVPARGGKLPITTGLVKTWPAERDLVSVAHGWFLDDNRDVLDVAVFVSKSALDKDLESCRAFATQILATTELGDRRLTYGSGQEVETKVSYATFRYRLPEDWMLAESMGIHDFARMHFRKRGVFPDGFVELQLALDSHPGDWASDGKPDGDRKGNLLGLPVVWHLTKEGPGGTLGAWTISAGEVHRDRAVASIATGSAADREDALRFAESIRVGR